MLIKKHLDDYITARALGAEDETLFLIGFYETWSRYNPRPVKLSELDQRQAKVEQVYLYFISFT